MLIKESRVPIKEMILTGWMPARLKAAYYRSKGAKIGKNVKIGLGAVLIADRLEVGDNTRIGFATIIRGREVKIGSYTYIGSTTFLDVEKIFIGDDAKINEQVFAGGPMFPDSYLHIGSRTTVMQHTFLNPSKPLIIHDGVGIGGRCSIFTHSSWQNIFEGYPVKFAGIEIGENAWIPWDVFILPGVSIGAGATVGAGSLVIKDIPPMALAAGVPAKLLRNTGEYVVAPSTEEKIAMLENILEEFKDFLAYHGHSMEIIQQEKSVFISYRVKDDNGRVVGNFVVFLGEAKNINRIETGKDWTVISLFELNQEELRWLDQQMTLWVDIAKTSRGGTYNDLGEQLIDFLKRYGLHLKRTALV